MCGSGLTDVVGAVRSKGPNRYLGEQGEMTRSGQKGQNAAQMAKEGAAMVQRHLLAVSMEAVG